MRICLAYPAASDSGKILARLLAERGVEVVGRPQAEAIVSWGVPIRDPDVPTLNANAGMGSKLEQLERLKEIGVSVPPFGRTLEGLKFPILGRRAHHTGGKDILPLLGPSPANEMLAQQFDYFTQFVPHRRELRVWVYRGRRLGVYEKVLVYPERLHGVAQNWRNGYAFRFVEEPPPTLVPVVDQAIRALELDFGAADVLETGDGEYVVLEVNTRPGVEGARACITNLANRIVRWGQNGFPRRRNG